MRDTVFKCPKCGCTELELWVACHHVVYPINIDPHTGKADYDPADAELVGGNTCVFICADCGYEPVFKSGDPVVYLEGVKAWIEENQKEEKINGNQ